MISTDVWIKPKDFKEGNVKVNHPRYKNITRTLTNIRGDIDNIINDIIENDDINILLETDLKPFEIPELFSNFSSGRIMLNYDTGNSAFWGFNSEDELPLYGDKIGNIHIKDCTPQKYSVDLGMGNVNFSKSFKFFK